MQEISSGDHGQKIVLESQQKNHECIESISEYVG